VSGVEVLGGDGAEGELDADLVVAATGRSARIPAWLEERRPTCSRLCAWASR